MNKYIYGADTETIHGKPLTFQFFSKDCPCEDLIFVNESNALDSFLKWCRQRRPDVHHVIYVHNLEYDLVEFLYGHHTYLVTPTGEFDFTYSGWRISGVYGKPTYCRLTHGHNRSILMVDSYSFIRCSLEKVAELFCPDLPKLKRPEGLGEKRFTRKDTDFCAYAMRDAEITYYAGKALESLHQEFDLTQTVSIADMSARVFRHKYLKKPIPQPGDDILTAALLSYHGGKNNITVPPGWYLRVSALDISSAYPHAMSSFPAFSERDAYKQVEARGRSSRLPDLGIYRIRGHVSSCKWPSLYNHSFKPLQGYVEDVWVTGYELRQAQERDEINLIHARGYCYDPSDQDYQESAFKAFVEEFYRRKSIEKDKVKRMMYKLILNSLSGKFIQTRKSKRAPIVDCDHVDRINTCADLIAGGLFHPFIASLITGHTRARIHDLEHEYEALHTATDGIFTQHKYRESSSGLGAVTCEAVGDLLLIRNKLYILYSESGDIPSQAFENKKIRKYALHGFQGSVHDLERLIATNRRKYQAYHVNRLKESVRRNLQPNLFEKREYVLKVGPIPVVPPLTE